MAILTVEDSSKVNRTSPMVSIIFSFYNEELVLDELITRTRSTLLIMMEECEILDFEIIFVNDASTDRSREIILERIERFGKIKLIDMSRNFGNTECTLTGIRHAVGDVVIFLDSDLQDPPELIRKMVASWRADPEAEVVYTTRAVRRGEHPLKLLLTHFGYRLINKISEVKLPVDSGDFKLLSRRAVRHLLEMDEAVPYLRGMVSWIGFKQVQLFYERDGRFDGAQRTKFPVLSARVWNGYLDRALISFSDVPLKIILLIGLVVAISALAYIFVVLIQKFVGNYVPGWPAMMAAVLLLGGLQLVVTGIVGLYIGTIFKQTKRRPTAIIKSISQKE